MRVTAILVLAIPASAAAQSRTLGSPLAAPPDAAFGCETKPALTAQSFNGDYFFVPSGVPDCTWFQSGVIGSVDYSDPRTGSVPADGTITNVTIRTGDTPAAMGIVIVRQIGGVLIGGGSTSVCCAFVSETPLPALAPRTTNSFPVNIPVERNIRGTSAVADYVGISALSNTGFLPLLDTGDNNTLTGYRPGSPDAGFFYPRMGATEAPGGGTRNNESIPNVEVLLQWTWTPAGGVPDPPGTAAATADTDEPRYPRCADAAGDRSCECPPSPDPACVRGERRLSGPARAPQPWRRGRREAQALRQGDLCARCQPERRGQGQAQPQGQGPPPEAQERDREPAAVTDRRHAGRQRSQAQALSDRSLGAA